MTFSEKDDYLICDYCNEEKPDELISKLHHKCFTCPWSEDEEEYYT